jgi:hypothetical protein
VTYVVACRVPNGLDIGSGVVLRGNYVGPEFPAKPVPPAPARERIAGYEITRDVPDDVFERWTARAQFEASGAVFGSQVDQEVTEWCWAHARSHGHAHGAPQGA